MVKALLYVLCLCWLGMGRLQATPFVDAAIDSMNSQAHFPLHGIITITHSKEEKIDPRSFVMEGKPLETSFVKDVKMSASPDTLVSLYSFQLPAQDKGLYILPSISVKIGGQIYTTTPSTYEVQEETAAPSTVSAAPTRPSTPVIFRLEASVQGPSILYPGERTKLLYRIFYNRSIDLTRSVLPMVHPAHFQKVGDVQVRDYQIQDVTVQDLTQEVEASEVGTFSFGPSLIEGYAYSIKAGQKIYDATLLKSEAPVITLEVQPFPALDQPASFTGALGNIQIAASLISSNRVVVGDTLQLQVKVQGITNLTELHLPLLQCEPRFSGFFQISDLPPLAEIEGNTKIFDVELRPLTALINQIPSIEVSSFDPSTGKYIIQRIDPIPLTVQPYPLETLSLSSLPLVTQLPSIGKWPAPLLPPLEIKENEVNKIQITPSWWKGSWVFWMIPIGVTLLLLQKYWRKQWEKRPRPQISQSETLLRKALKTGNLHLLEKAFWLRLWEKKIVPQDTFDLNKLKNIEKHTFLYAFIFQLQALQYSLNKTFDPLQLRESAKQLFYKI
jgi:hypothetical protein